MSKESRKVLADQSRIQTIFGEPERQNRWSLFFRGILLIPLVLVLFIRLIAVEVLVFVGWFCALIMGRLPARSASYIARNIQFLVRVQAYGSLMLDEYPPLSLDDHEYPVEVSFNPGRVGRLSVLFRLILSIPAAIVENTVTGGFFIAALFVWLIVLIRGRMPRSLFDALAAMLRYSARYSGYRFMVSSAYPGELFGDAVLISTPWPPAEGVGPGYPPPPPSPWSSVVSPPATPSAAPWDGFPNQAPETPMAPYPRGSAVRVLRTGRAASKCSLAGYPSATTSAAVGIRSACLLNSAAKRAVRLVQGGKANPGLVHCPRGAVQRTHSNIFWRRPSSVERLHISGRTSG